MKDVMEFVRECVRLTWKMVIQCPPMTFDASQFGEEWSSDGSLELMEGSDPTTPSAVIQYYKAPKLLHREVAMVKGVVFVHKSKNP